MQSFDLASIHPTAEQVKTSPIGGDTPTPISLHRPQVTARDSVQLLDLGLIYPQNTVAAEVGSQGFLITYVTQTPRAARWVASVCFTLVDACLPGSLLGLGRYGPDDDSGSCSHQPRLLA